MFKQISFESQVAKLKLKVHKAELLVHECKLDMHRAEMWLKENLNDLLQLELGKRIFDLQASAVRKREQDGAPKKPVCCGNNEGDSARIVRLSFEKQFDQRKLRVSNAENTVKQATLEVDEAELELKKLLSKLTSDLYLKGSQLKRRLIVFFCKFSLSSSVESNSGWNPDCTRRANLLLHCARLRIWRNLKILPCHIGSCVTVLSASGLLLTVWVAKQQAYTSN